MIILNFLRQYPSFLLKKVRWWKGRPAEGKMVKGGKWTVLSVQSGSVVFVA